MATDEIMKLLIAERNKLDAAIRALSDGGGGGNIPSLFTAKAAKKTGKAATEKAKHIMSPEARAKIAAAQKARWAKAKKAVKTEKKA